MTKKAFYQMLEQIALRAPEYSGEIGELARLAQAAENIDDVLRDYLAGHPGLAEQFRGCPEAAEAPAGRVFPVHKPLSNEIRQRMKLAEKDEHYRNWANAVKALPQYTSPLPDVDGAFIRKAREIWSESIYGNEAILQVILRHSVQYARTGKTMPILLVGEPGVGKTLVAKNYGRILNLPASFISGPSASAGRGLSGAPNLYVGAGVGAIVQSMIDHGVGNPVIAIDEIEKATAGYSRAPDFQNELLSALDENNVAWRDNYLEMEVDASHIPFIFTANDKALLPPPLLDRMEVIPMEKPTLEMIHSITRNFTLPNAIKAFGNDRIEFGEQELDMLVDMLWQSGNRSCRAYQKAVELLVSNACLNVIESGNSVRVTQKDIRNTAAAFMDVGQRKPIGF